MSCRNAANCSVKATRWAQTTRFDLWKHNATHFAPRSTNAIERLRGGEWKLVCQITQLKFGLFHQLIQFVAVTAAEGQAGAVFEDDGVFAMEERLQFLDAIHIDDGRAANAQKAIITTKSGVSTRPERTGPRASRPQRAVKARRPGLARRFRASRSLRARRPRSRAHCGRDARAYCKRDACAPVQAKVLD